MLVLQEDISDGYSRKEILLPQVFCKIQEAQKDGYKNKNELKRRIDLFLHDFTHEEYRINEEYCKETMRIMVDFIGHVDNRLDAADKRLKKAKAGEKLLQNTLSQMLIVALYRWKWYANQDFSR